MEKLWYAVMRDRDDQDWGTGADTLEEAMEMAHNMNAEYIAVIAGEGNAAVCVAEIEIER